MAFDEWVDAEFAIDNDPDSFEHRLAKRAWDAAVKAEREACAKILDEFSDCSPGFLARKIRMRSNGKGDEHEQ